ncbi:hypothetical protein WA556_003405 [Blastocystis sp. ATCC 50177/Nand II]
MLIQQILEKNNIESEKVKGGAETAQPSNTAENQFKLEKEEEETAYVSEGETNLVDDLNKILDDSGSRVESSHEPSIAIGEPVTHSDFDTMTLQDILNRADTTFVCRESTVGTSDTHSSAPNTNQSRLPSLSKEIIGMLIDIDNANYSKKEEEEESPSIIERDPRLSDTVISSNPFPASSKPRLQPIPEDAPEVRVPSTSTKQEETITPNTCFDGYSSSELMALCAKYKKRVIDEGRSEDVEILLNINSAISQQLSTNAQPSTSPPSSALVREGSLVVVPRDSVVAREEEEDCWEKNVDMNEEGTSEATVDAKEATAQPTPPVTPSVTPSVTTMPPEAYCLRPRETVIGVARRKEIEEGGSLPTHQGEVEITELPSESDSLLERSPSREHTYVEVDLDLDNPVVSEDSEEARRRFCAAMKQSVEAMRQHREVPLFVKQLHEKRGKDGLETRESLVGGIAESVARAKIGRKREEPEGTVAAPSSLGFAEKDRNALPAQLEANRKSQEKRCAPHSEGVESPPKERRVDTNL